MSRQRSSRYDTIKVPTEPSLYRMYIGEGLSEDEAHKKAKDIHRFLDSAGRTEARFWQRVREHEMTDGLEPDTTMAKEHRYAS